MKIKQKTLVKVETLSSIAWFATDFLSMWQLTLASLLLQPFIATGMILCVIYAKNKNLKRISLITLMWFSMNCIWLIADFFKEPTANIFFKIIASTFGVIGLFQLLFWFLIDPKKIENFKRFINSQLHEA